MFDLEKKLQDYYKNIQDALEIMQLHDRITFSQIKEKYKELMKKYHPDHCRDTPTLCEEKSKNIINAYKVLQKYCQDFRFSFSEEEVKSQPHHNWWAYRFGGDKTWGK